MANRMLPLISAAANMVKVANRLTPAASPSTPSIRLTAFEVPTSHSTVNGKPHHSSPPMRTPAE